MNPYEGPGGENFRPGDDSDTDMITVNPPRWQRWRPARPIAVAGVAVVALAGGAGAGYAATHSVAKQAANPATVAAAAAAASPSASPVPMPRPGRHWRVFGDGPGFPGGIPGGGAFRFARGPLGDGLIHGQFTAPKSGGGYQTYDAQQGTVTAVSANSVTVKSADGYTFTYTVTSKTVVDAQAAGIGSVKKGDTVFVIATVSGTTATAANVLDITAVKAGHASFGFPDRPKNLPSAPAKAPTA
jgi:hypothetical protein